LRTCAAGGGAQHAGLKIAAMRVDAARRLQHRRFRRDPQLLQLRKRRIIPPARQILRK
jgi:hypothetical protein